MAPKRSHSSLSRVSRDLNCVEEWVISVSNKAALNQLVVDGVLLDRAMVGWHPAHDESFPTPRSDELVVFEDYFYHGFCILIHPFLYGLIEYYAISLCNLGPSSILHIFVFIHFCEAYLGILPHFDLFHHFFCLKSRGVSRSRVVGSAYLQLLDGMVGQYITTPLNTNMKYWAQRWFYMPQGEHYVACNIDQIPMSSARW